MVAAARGLGLSTVVVTGAHFQGLPADIVQTLAIEPRAAWMVATPRLASRPSGTAICSRRFWSPRWWRACRPRPRSAAPFPVVYGVLEKTVRRQSYEMALMASTERLLHPDRRFAPVRYPATRGCSALAGSSRRIPMTSVAMLKRIPQ
jgi:pyridoxine kinase